jgi:predicted flap endonuclease-1-like 5' DNA nuclease
LIWAGLAYLLGCYLGCWFRKMGAGADAPPPVTKTVTPPPPPVKKPEIPAVAKAAIPAAAAVATAVAVKEVMTPKPVVVPKAPPPPPPRPVVKVEPVKVEPMRVAKVEPAKVITREMHTKADPLPTVRASTTTLPNHLTRKAEEIHHDKNIRHVDGGADRVLETRAGTTRMAEAKPVVVEPRRVVAEPVRTTVAPVAAQPVRAAAPVAAPAAAPVETGGMSRPKGIAAARGNRPDDLQRISGVGPKNEKILHKLGFYHFDQIAGWSASEAAWVDDHLKFGGRVKRENWIHQASLLASGKEAEFLKQYGTGGLKNSSGDKVSGSKTRK